MIKRIAFWFIWITSLLWLILSAGCGVLFGFVGMAMLNGGKEEAEIALDGFWQVCGLCACLPVLVPLWSVFGQSNTMIYLSIGIQVTIAVTFVCMTIYAFWSGLKKTFSTGA